MLLEIRISIVLCIFLYFMGGPKHVGELSQADSKGFFKPENARINFAVPS